MPATGLASTKGGGVDHNLDPVIGHRRPRGARIGDRAQHRDDLCLRDIGTGAQFTVNLIQSEFADVEQHQFARRIGHQLPAKL
jgi:hypothetical protein